jgi:hypothetical protein
MMFRDGIPSVGIGLKVRCVLGFTPTHGNGLMSRIEEIKSTNLFPAHWNPRLSQPATCHRRRTTLMVSFEQQLHLFARR